VGRPEIPKNFRPTQGSSLGAEKTQGVFNVKTFPALKAPGTIKG
jgi:hypothetical protein